MRIRIVVLILTCASIKGVACTCFFSPEKKWGREIISSAEVIFIGTARLDVSIENVKFWGPDSLVQIENLVFEINEEFKGLKGKRKIKLGSHGCDGGYKIGRQYLIFGYDGNPKMLRADECGSYTENGHQGGTNLGSKHFRNLKELVLEEKKRLKF